MDYMTTLMDIMKVRSEISSRKVIEIKSIVAKNIFNLIKEEIRDLDRSKPFHITFEMLLRDEMRKQYENELYYAFGKYDDNPKYWNRYWRCFLVGVEMKREMLDEISENINKISQKNKALSGISAKIVEPFHGLEISISWFH